MSNMKTSLYNNDGTLSAEAQSLLFLKPDNMLKGEWIKAQKQFHSKLTSSESKEFKRLKRNARQVRWLKQNPDKDLKAKERQHAWRKANPEKRKLSRQKALAKLIKSKHWRSPTERIRRVVARAFKRLSQLKYANTEAILGCSYQEALKHFESLFVEGMSWDNYGEWHVDHIRPLASFTEVDIHLANRIENLQPLWAEDNIKKSDRYPF